MSKRFSLIAVAIYFLCTGGPLQAGEGHMHGPNGEHVTTESSATPDNSSRPEIATTGEASGTETEFELGLAQLGADTATGRTAIENATVSGFLKRATTGAIVGRVSSASAGTPGRYQLSVDGRPAIGIAEAGAYLLEINIAPRKGEAFDTTLNFELPAAESNSASRIVPIIAGALGLLLVGSVLRKISRDRKTSGRGGFGGGEHTTVAVVLLLTTSLLSPRLLIAGEGHMHGPNGEHLTTESSPSASEEPALRSGSAVIQIGEVTAISKAGSIELALLARTKPVSTTAVSRPGEVRLAPQTAAMLDIKVEPVRVASLATGTAFNGRIAPEPDSQVRVTSLVPGRITRLLVRQGDAVSQGDVMAVIESRSIGEAQSAYAQASSRLQNARTNYDIVLSQVRAGVFARGPLEAARRIQAQARADLSSQEATLRDVRIAYDNALRLASAGAYGRLALESAVRAEAAAKGELNEAETELTDARETVRQRTADLKLRQEQVAAGNYSARPVEEAQRAYSTAQGALSSARTEVTSTQANLTRVRALSGEGLVSKRDLETAQSSFEQANSRLETARSIEEGARAELERQRRLADSRAGDGAQIQEARSSLGRAQNAVRQATTEVGHKRDSLRLAEGVRARERRIYDQNVNERREVTQARNGLSNARAGMLRARQALGLANSALNREVQIFDGDVNNRTQIQSARSSVTAAQADVEATRSALNLLRSSPGSSASVQVRAPIGGTVSERTTVAGEVVTADASLFAVIDLRRVAVEASLFEADLPRVKLGQLVRVTVSSLPGRSFSGRLSFIGSSVDSQSRVVDARAVIDNGGGVLRPGMFVAGQIESGRSGLAITVPLSAVLDDGAAKIVFVPQNASYLRREIKTGRQNAGRVEVLNGLSQAEQVVTSGSAAIRAQLAKN